MAIFLFFLSVAMVSTNRMDISLGLSVDHRLKADAAARAGLNWALRTMRTDPNWAKTLKGGTPVLESGARIEVEVRARSNDTGNPFLLVVTSVGSSGLVSVRHWAVVEEVRKPKVAGKDTQVFSRSLIAKDGNFADNGLAMLGQDFQWYQLSELPTADKEPNTIEAGGGPLFTFAPEGTAQEPPSIITALPLFLPTGQQVSGPMIRLELVPPGRHLVTLELDPTSQAMTWVDVPDPGPQLGRWGGMPEIEGDLKNLPVIRMWEDPRKAEQKDEQPWESRNIRLTGKEREDSGSGYDILTVDTDKGIWDEDTGTYKKITDSVPWAQAAMVESKTPTELTLDWSEISDNLLVYLEWYSITGEAIAARGDKIACQGLHTFYGQYPYSGEQKFVEFGTPLYETIVYQAPCVLEYDLKEKKWTKLVDLMSIPKLNSPPLITRSRQWRANFLEVNSKDQVFITTKKRISIENLETNLVRYNSLDRHVSHGTVPGAVPRVVLYDERPYYLNQSGYLPGTSTPRRFLSGFHGQQLDPTKQLGGHVPPITASVPEGEQDTEYQFKPAEEIAVGLAGERFDIISHGKELLALGLVRRHVEDDDTFPQLGDFNQSGPYALTSKKTMVALLRYDGEAWQVWPGGSSDLLKSFKTSANPRALNVPRVQSGGVAGATDITLIPGDGLALASYPFDQPVLNRYAVIAAGKNDPPPLAGFEAE